MPAEAVAAGRQATAPASQAVDLDMSRPSAMLALVAVGLCVLAVWVIRRLARPAKLSLAGTPGRPNAVHPAHILILLLLWLGSMYAVRQVAAAIWPEDSPQLVTAVNLVGQAAWLVGSLVVAAMAFRSGLARGLGLSARHWVYDGARGILAYFAAIPICFGLLAASVSIYQAIHGEAPPEHTMLQALDKVTLPWQVVVIFSAVVMAPLSEEVFCRGLLQSMVRRYTSRPWAAVVVSAVFFSLMHMTSAAEGRYVVWTPVPPLLALGIVLGYNYERSGRLLAPILTHAIFNAVNVAMYLYG